MKNKYNDFCICSPKEYEIIAKNYAKQLQNKQINANEYNNLNIDHILNILEKNISFLENSSFFNNKINYYQKIYIKTYNLFESFKKLQKDYISPTPKNIQLTSLNNFINIKTNSINNLHSILMEIINNYSQDLQTYAIEIINLLKLWNG